MRRFPIRDARARRLAVEGLEGRALLSSSSLVVPASERPSAEVGGLAAEAPGSVEIGLLLPAVQKVREAASR